MKLFQLLSQNSPLTLFKTAFIMLVLLLLVSCESDDESSSIDESMTLLVNGQNYNGVFTDFYASYEDEHIYISADNYSAEENLDLTISMFDFPLNGTGVFEGYDHTSSTRCLTLLSSFGDHKSTDSGSNSGELPSPIFTITTNNENFVEGSFSGMVLDDLNDNVISVSGAFKIAYDQ